jgi:hypothetical protein
MSLLCIRVLGVLVALGQTNTDTVDQGTVREEQMRFLKEKSAELTLFRLPDTKSPLPHLERACCATAIRWG